MKYVAPVAETVAVESVNVLLASGEVVGCTCEQYVSTCTAETEAPPLD